MSYVALVTNRFDEVIRFYGELLGFPVVAEWDRSNAQGRRFDAGGMKIEIIDNEREQHPRELGEPVDRVHIVIEVDDINQASLGLKLEAPPIEDTSWGSRIFQVRDPDGIPVTFIQWIEEA